MAGLQRDSWMRRWLPAAIIVAFGVLAYANSFDAAFVYDGIASVIRDSRVQTFAIEPGELDGNPYETSLTGRPVAMFTFVVNYKISGEAVWSYHAVNLIIHIAAALLLMGLVRQTLRAPVFDKPFTPHLDAVALVVALLWMVHPLQTGSITYIIQRIEALMSLFYMLTIYAAARGFVSPRPGRWYALAVIACLLGVGTKEVMISAPLAVLLYDRLFFADSLSETLRRRWRLYLGLALTWVPLAWLVSLGARSNSVGFHHGVDGWTYLCTQAWVILYYLRLTIWPSPLVLDYGMADYGVTMLRSFSQYAPYGIVVVLLLIGTVYAIARRSWIGFVGAIFFMVLAPSSSFVPIVTEVLAEHRMYLPLASLVVLAVVGAHLGLRRLRVPGAAQLALAGVVALTLTAMSAARNRDYQSYLYIWEDTARKWPSNARAHYNRGIGLVEADRVDLAMEAFRRAIALQDNYPDAHNNLGVALLMLDQPAQAIEHLEASLKTRPTDGGTLGNLGLARLAMDDIDGAALEFERAFEHGATDPDVHGYFGMILLQREQFDRALMHLEQSVIANDVPHFYGNLGMEYLRRQKWTRAGWAFENLLRLTPNDANGHALLGLALVEQGRLAEAAERVATALHLEPGNTRAATVRDMINARVR